MRKPTLQKLFVLLVLVPPLAAALTLAARWGWADLGLRAAARQTAEWRANEAAGKGRADSGDWVKVHDALARAADLQPSSPVFPEVLGMMQMQRSLNDPLAMVFQTDAVGSFQRATIARPSSPYQWANIAWLKHRQGEIDADFYAALETAATLGPWEREVQLVVLDLGLAVWEDAPPKTRKMVEIAWKNAQVRLQKEAVAIANIRKKLAVMCAIDHTPQLMACNSAPEGAK